MEQETGICPHCGFVNRKDWILCDACGQRLPWAPPAKPRPGVDELSDEQLAVLFGPPARRRDRPLWMQDYRTARIVFIVAGLLAFALFDALFGR